MWRKGYPGTLVPLYCREEGKFVQALWKTIWMVLRKLKIYLPYDSAIPFLCLYPKKMNQNLKKIYVPPYPKEIKSGYQKDICTTTFIEALFTMAKIWKQPKCPSPDRWLKNFTHTYTHNMYVNITQPRERTFCLCNNMDGS